MSIGLSFSITARLSAKVRACAAGSEAKKKTDPSIARGSSRNNDLFMVTSLIKIYDRKI
jgi:hypothetical protein